ncbi:MAG: NAD(P)/FAD-dependent oxidoreductase [Planctomycetota bacterium]|nr:NAD(P)/FAD-dependent oxidoreductase [Planctomycetota bacterium]
MDAVIIGGGLAGLTCAHYLNAAGKSFLVLDAGSEIGGRVRTDFQEGFRFDRGFQVFLTSYPEARRVLDYDKLNLRYFNPGALVRTDNRFCRFVDPWRRPWQGLLGLFTRSMTFRDGITIARWRNHVLKTPLDRLLASEEVTTDEALRRMGFSNTVRETFLRPFLGGIFLDAGLETSSRMMDFVFRMFCSGDAALPAEGMQAIPRQIAAGLPPGSIRSGTPVASIEDNSVHLQNGETISARCVVVATQAPECRRLLYDPYPADGRSVTCLYYTMQVPPHSEPTLILNGTGRGPINNLAVLSAVAPEYAPPGRALVSVTVLGCAEDDAALGEKVRRQLEEWYGVVARRWEMLQSYRIRYALPAIPCPALQTVSKPSVVRPGVFACGDHCDTPSINGAMASGRRAAEAVIAAEQASLVPR